MYFSLSYFCISWRRCVAFQNKRILYCLSQADPLCHQTVSACLPILPFAFRWIGDYEEQLSPPHKLLSVGDIFGGSVQIRIGIAGRVGGRRSGLPPVCLPSLLITEQAACASLPPLSLAYDLLKRWPACPGRLARRSWSGSKSWQEIWQVGGGLAFEYFPHLPRIPQSCNAPCGGVRKYLACTYAHTHTSSDRACRFCTTTKKSAGACLSFAGRLFTPCPLHLLRYRA